MNACGENLEELIMSFATLSRAERETGSRKTEKMPTKKVQEGPKYATSIGDEDSISEYRHKTFPRMNLTLLGELNTR